MQATPRLSGASGTSTLLAVAILVAHAVPSLVAAQEGRSIFSVLDTRGRSIGPAPAIAEGTLEESDLLSGEGRRVQAWGLAAAPGDELQLDLRSDDFDAYVYVVGPGLGSGLSDDDGGEDLDSRICVAIGEPGEYRVIASSLSGETGTYTLEVRLRPGATSGTCEEDLEEAPEITDPAELPTEGRVLSVGDAMTGSLDADDPNYLGSPADAWVVPGRAGAPFSVDLISEDFDAYLELEGDLLDDVLSDDDGAGRCDARITLTFPADGTYLLVVTTLGSGTGSYRLVASASPGPVDSRSCVPSTETSTSEASDPDAVTIVGELVIGENRQGTMTASDAEYAGSYFQGWTLEARAGDRLAIENVSDDFDSYLYFAGPGFPEPIYDDDSAGSLDARICVEIPETATYRVLAGPLSGRNQGGRYTLRATTSGLEQLCTSYDMTPDAAMRRLAELPTEGRSIRTGEVRDGSLDPAGLRHPDTDRVVQAWAIELDGGREVSVDLVSDAFDPVLYVLGPGLEEPLYVDDAEGGTCNSRITFTPASSGSYRVLAGAYYDGGGGPFQLRVSTNPDALRQGGCVSPTPSTAGPDAAPATGGALAGISSGEARVLELGTEVEGTLDASDETLATGEPAEAWVIEVAANETVVFELLSDDFDCILFVDDGGGSPQRDDDGAGNLDSRVVYTATQDRTVRVVVSALSAGNSGAFRLRAIRRAS